MYRSTHICTAYIQPHSGRHSHSHSHTHAHIFVYKHTHTQRTYTHTCTYTRIYIHIHPQTNTRPHSHTRMQKPPLVHSLVRHIDSTRSATTHKPAHLHPETRSHHGCTPIRSAIRTLKITSTTITTTIKANHYRHHHHYSLHTAPHTIASTLLPQCVSPGASVSVR